MMMMMMMAMTMMIAIVLPMALLSMWPKPLIYDAAAPSWVCTALDKYYCKWARDECVHTVRLESQLTLPHGVATPAWRICIWKVTDE